MLRAARLLSRLVPARCGANAPRLTGTAPPMLAARSVDATGCLSQRTAVSGVPWRWSSSLAGISRSGMPRLEYDAKGKAVGAQKGGKGRKLLGGVIAIKNSWNNTLISISNSDYKQLGWVSAGKLQHAPI